MQVEVFLVFVLLRQINGEYVFLKGEKAFYSEHSANEMVSEFNRQFTQDNQPMKLETPYGLADCFCEIGIFRTPIDMPVTTLYVVAVAARQIDGEFVSINVNKAFNNKEEADRHVNIVRTNYTKEGNPVPTKIMTPQGAIDCMCEVGVFEMEIQ